MSENSKKGLSTRAIHGHGFNDAHGSPHPPVYDTSTFAFKSTADLLDVVEGRKPGSLYTRYGLNPSIFAIDEMLRLSRCSTFVPFRRRRMRAAHLSPSTTPSLHRSISARWNSVLISLRTAPPSISAGTATSPLVH